MRKITNFNFASQKQTILSCQGFFGQDCHIFFEPREGSMRPFYLVRRRCVWNHIYQIMARYVQKELHPKSFTQIPSQMPKAERKKQSETRDEVPLPENGTLPVPNCGAMYKGRECELNVKAAGKAFQR